MIYDSFTSMDKYFQNNSTWTTISRFIQEIDVSIPNGRYEICKGVFAMVSRYPTKCSVGSEMEVHHKYVDVQCLLCGSELIGYQHIDSDLAVTELFDTSNDIGFFKSTQYSTVLLQPGVFTLFPTGEYHMPQLQVVDGKSEDVLKVVVKIEKDLLF